MSASCSGGAPSAPPPASSFSLLTLAFLPNATDKRRPRGRPRGHGKARLPEGSRASRHALEGGTYIPAALRSASTRSVRSQVKSGSSRPKWPYAAVWE
ncbi:hypothetical protein GCM10010103_50340 [Streptomyces paradoxus]